MCYTSRVRLVRQIIPSELLPMITLASRKCAFCRGLLKNIAELDPHKREEDICKGGTVSAPPLPCAVGIVFSIWSSGSKTSQPEVTSRRSLQGFVVLFPFFGSPFFGSPFGARWSTSSRLAGSGQGEPQSDDRGLEHRSPRGLEEVGSGEDVRKLLGWLRLGWLEVAWTTVN